MTPKKEKALAALLTHSTRKEAATAAGVSSRTLRGYFEDPEFAERYRAAFGGMVEDATRQAQQAIAPALSTLREIMRDTDAQATARIQASRSILEYAVKLGEQLDVLTRMAELERAISALEGER